MTAGMVMTTLAGDSPVKIKFFNSCSTIVLNSMGVLNEPLLGIKKLSPVPIFLLKAANTLAGSFSTYSRALSPIRMRSFLKATTLGRVTFMPEGFLKISTPPLFALAIRELVVPRSMAKLIVDDIYVSYFIYFLQPQ